MRPGPATGGLPSPQTKISASLRRRLPFAAFLLGFTLYCAYLQFQLYDALSRLFLVRIFFQVALAALVIATMRNVVGVRTLGMFAPAIIALAFLATGLPLGLALLGLILAIVLLTRGAVLRERIQESHRVAILVTMVGITISSIALIGLEFNLHELFFSVLFPVLITAWMGERYVEQVTRVGWEGPTKTLVWTMTAIVISFLLITQDPLVDFVMLNPLLWPVLILLNWFLGTHVRLRLSERFRFLGVRHYVLSSDPVRGDFSDDVLTMTVRNREFVAKYNPPDLMARLGKDEAKALLMPQGIPVARTYMIIREKGDLAFLKAWFKDHYQFALKPASGYGGEGILLVRGMKNGVYDTDTGLLEPATIEAHAARIVDGEFNGGQPDAALVEELLVQDEALRDLAPIGLADIRVICFRGYPVMAMVRIPTVASGGKANIHVGAVAAGISISTSTIIHSVWRGVPQPYHPDTGQLLLGRKLPFWDEILEVAAEAQRLTGLGFAGVDVALDARRGPVVMEVNRRPGLEIQNANGAGLLRRLKAIDALQTAQLPAETRIKIVKQLDSEGWGLRTRRSTDSPAA